MTQAQPNQAGRAFMWYVTATTPDSPGAMGFDMPHNKHGYAFHCAADERTHAKHTPITPNTPARQVILRYPRIVGHLICDSLGYATPTCAAHILRDAITGQENWCEWIYSCYKCDPRPPVRSAIQYRKTHTGFMASYVQAKALVDRFIEKNDEPMFAAWF